MFGISASFATVAGYRRGLERVSGARRYVVEDYRHIDGLGYRLEVRVNLVLRRGGEVRRDYRKRVRPDFLRVERELYRSLSAGAAGSRKNWDAARRGLDHRLDYFFLLVGRHRVELAVRAEAEDARDARVYLAVYLIFEFLVVDALVLVHRRDDGGDDSSDFHFVFLLGILDDTKRSEGPKPLCVVCRYCMYFEKLM